MEVVKVQKHLYYIYHEQSQTYSFQNRTTVSDASEANYLLEKCVYLFHKGTFSPFSIGSNP